MTHRVDKLRLFPLLSVLFCLPCLCLSGLFCLLLSPDIGALQSGHPRGGHLGRARRPRHRGGAERQEPLPSGPSQPDRVQRVSEVLPGEGAAAQETFCSFRAGERTALGEPSLAITCRHGDGHG